MPGPKPGRTIRRSGTIERVQALAMHACGKNAREIETVTDIAPGAFGMLLKKCKSRGYVVGEKILEEYVIDGKPASLKGTTADPDDSLTPRKAAAKKTPKKKVAGKAAVAAATSPGDDEDDDAKPTKLEPMEDFEDDYGDMDTFPSQPDVSKGDIKPKASTSYTPEQPPSASYDLEANGYSTEPIPFNLQKAPFKLEPMEEDEEDYAI